MQGRAVENEHTDDEKTRIDDRAYDARRDDCREGAFLLNRAVGKPGEISGENAFADADEYAADGIEPHEEHDRAAVPAENTAEKDDQTEYAAQQSACRAAVDRSANDYRRERKGNGNGTETDKVAEDCQHDDDRREQRQTHLPLQPFARG